MGMHNFDYRLYWKQVIVPVVGMVVKISQILTKSEGSKNAIAKLNSKTS